ncbi:unnamed protein product [Rotaria sp. Silwood1]|nr:unnamed protein product [Rotaria sp. Silwood1]CAF4621733.1 unnamed protein product [Rotaria sp. Silwood1]
MSTSSTGTETVDITAGESANPRRDVPSVMTGTIWRIILFFWINSVSPFTLVFVKSGIKPAVHIMNAVILTTILSAGNSALYACTRILFVLVNEGKAPKHFTYVTRHGLRNNQAMFDAYVSLRKIAQKYELEEELAIPRVIFVGETSSGKSMLVQNFLRFPCAFSHSDVGTRCPILYRLRYNPTLDDDVIIIKHPSGIKQPQDLAEHLRQVMEQIEREDGFRIEEYLVHIESNQYRDFEILDVPGLISGSWDSEHAKAVERITEHYVRDPTFLIVQLKEATQLGVNSFGMKRIREFCLMDPAPCGSPLPPRRDYEDYTLTIQTKFDIFMDGHKDGSQANDDMAKLLEHFNQQTSFVSMIFDAYSFGKHTYEENAKYIANLPELEFERVDNWIRAMKDSSKQSNNSLNQFDETRFRSLIGINIVRDRIQDMWVQAFRGALPKIQQVLQELVQEQKLQYQALISLVEEKDLKAIRKLYKRYIQTFRSTISNYIAFRAEISARFDLETYGRTYAQFEEEYNRWPRKISFSWLAHQTAEQMNKVPIERRLQSLPLRYVGARHFERIRQVFYYMILTYQPIERQQDWIESAQGILYGVNADNENLEKGARELLYTYISETFVMAICWLTQVYSFLLDHFEQQVTDVLLSSTGDFALLAKGHEKFLSYVRLEYHRTTRQMIRRAVEASKHARRSKMIYAAHSICDYLRTLVESFPPTIQENQKEETSTSDINLRRLVYHTQTFLPENRNSETASYLPTMRNTTNQIYSAIRGLLLQDITANFFANVVIEVQHYDSVEIPDSLQHRLDQMSNEEIALMSQIDFEEHTQELQMIYEKLTMLEDACDEIKRDSRLFDVKVSGHVLDKKDQEKNISRAKRDHRHQELMNKLYQVQPKKIETEISNDMKDDDSHHDEDEYQLKILDNDPHTCQHYLLELYRKDDLDDLKHGFLPGDHFSTTCIDAIIQTDLNGEILNDWYASEHGYILTPKGKNRRVPRDFDHHHHYIYPTLHQITHVNLAIAFDEEHVLVALFHQDLLV